MKQDETKKGAITSVWSSIGVVASIAAILLAIVVGMIANSMGHLAPFSQNASSGTNTAEVKPTGEVTKVSVEARPDMTFSPNRIEVPVGNELIVTVTNKDSVSGHDLVIGKKATKRLQPGESEDLNAGVITASTTGQCSVAGHAQMGMKIDIVAIGSDQKSQHTETAGGMDHSSGSHAGHSMPMAISDVKDAKLTHSIDPVLQPLEPNSGPTTRNITLKAQEVTLEVSPGLYQKRWTFNGESMAPTLHGRVGDTFVITLINEGTTGHSIDFHAGALAPDKPMRTIKPGESLEYVFHANRAGIWMYHCSTMPMSSHIAAGMHGAVVIEPEDLDTVDASFVFVQSEIYFANAAHKPDEAKELDAAKILSRDPDRVVFNGIADQYVQNPLTLKKGQRARFWVLDAGPNEDFSFHIVGGQFDTTWTEGTYLIRKGVGAFDKATLGATAPNTGGAQVLPLLAAQGGFAELSFAEPGHYTAVNHVMSLAERGARAVIHVKD
ncbi:multicopper oxidase domain-containing protein [Arcanobacterium ihumii]|uniref:multicopper oxidase domain-containing protein n=1 Tax=Arcanobacterium ihumii TaxID=2138162 RepID=UPI000F52628E|nr:multicopper oxidase domain-containing protein [Arcanobacterium ihumii]